MDSGLTLEHRISIRFSQYDFSLIASDYFSFWITSNVTLRVFVMFADAAENCKERQKSQSRAAETLSRSRARDLMLRKVRDTTQKEPLSCLTEQQQQAVCLIFSTFIHKHYVLIFVCRYFGFHRLGSLFFLRIVLVFRRPFKNSWSFSVTGTPLQCLFNI